MKIIGKSLVNDKSNIVQAFWLGLGYFSSFAVGLGSAMILSRYFDKHEYGTYRQIVYVYNTLLVVFSAGVPRVYSYFLPKLGIGKAKDVANKVTYLLLGLGFLFSIFLYFSAGLIADILDNNDLEEGIRLFSPIPFFMLPTLGVEGIYTTYKNTFTIAVYNTISRLLMLLFIVLPVIIWKGSYVTAIYGWILVSVISFIYALYLKTVPFSKIRMSKSKISYKDIFAYSIPLVFASIAGVAIKSSNQYYISRYFGTEEFAEYSNGFIQLPFVPMITSATAAVLMPQISRLGLEGSEEISRLFQSALKRSAIILYPLVTFSIVFSPDIMTFVFSEKYLSSSEYFRISMCLNYFNIVVFAPILLGLGFSKFYSKIHIYGAISLWCIQAILIMYYELPLLIVSISILVNIGIVLLSINKVANILNKRISHIVPFKSLGLIVIQTAIIALLLQIGYQDLWMQGLPKLIILFCIYFFFISISGKYIHVDYLDHFKKIIVKR